MPTTSNFGWTTPADTDLVKDGALAIRTLGNGIDTSMAQLKGGTTGQVLSKTSNTDMAFTWVTQDDANAIQNAIVDAKGDLIAATANDTPARLAVGNNGETLVADSSATTGLRWQTPKSQNAVYNSSFQVWQRGTSASFGNASAGTGYIADRWQFIFTGNTGTGSRQATGDTTNLPNIEYCARVQRNSGNTGTQNVIICQTLENADSTRFIGQTITFSFYARRGSNFSGSSNNLSVVVASGTGTDQNVLYSFTGSSNVVNSSATLTTTWQRFSFTGPVSSSAKQIGFYLFYGATGTAGANDYFEVTGVQLETGSVATPYTQMSGTLAGELAACQRYYWRTTADSVYDRLSPYGTAENTGSIQINMQHPVQMRTAVSSIDYGGAMAVYDSVSIIGSLTALTLDNSNPLFTVIKPAKSASFTQFRPYCLIDNNANTAYIGFNAEL